MISVNLYYNGVSMKTIIIPPAECLENGCKQKSEKCHNCAYNYYPWFQLLAKIPEKCYNKGQKKIK